MKEALGPDNKYFCSKFYNRDVTDPEILLAYYIKYGGAEGYRKLHPPEDSGPGGSPS
jgi:hypothetical protein